MGPVRTLFSLPAAAWGLAGGLLPHDVCHVGLLAKPEDGSPTATATLQIPVLPTWHQADCDAGQLQDVILTGARVMLAQGLTVWPQPLAVPFLPLMFVLAPPEQPVNTA